MGSFSVSCGVSGLNIENGEDVVLFILNKKRFDKADFLFDYITDIYEPLYLPIFGKYDEYGGLYDIIEKESIKILENKTSLSIQKFIEDMIDKNNEYFFMFVNRDIYNSILSYNIDGCEKPTNLNNLDFLVPAVFEQLNFSLIKYENGVYFFTKGNNTVEFGNFSFKINNKSVVVKNINHFFKLWKKETGENFNVDLLKNIDIFYEEVKNRLYNNGISDLERFVATDIYGLSDLFMEYKDVIKKNDNLLHELADFVRFNWFLREINCLYRPSIVGLGENRALEILHQKSLLLLKDKNKNK